MTTRGDPRLEWHLNPPQPQPVTFGKIKNTGDGEIKYEVEPGLWETIGPGETKRYPLTPPKPIPMYEIRNGKWEPANEAAHDLAARVAAANKTLAAEHLKGAWGKAVGPPPMVQKQ